MKPTFRIKHDHFKFYQQSPSDPSTKAIARGYQLNLDKNTRCFVLIAVSQKKPERLGSYDLFIIKDARIFEFETLDETTFSEGILENLTHEPMWGVIDFILECGFGMLSERSFSLNKRLDALGLKDMQPQIDALLNPSAIDILKQLNLGIIPRIYNWLVETPSSQAQFRAKALLDYPILLAPRVCASNTETIPAVFNQDELSVLGSREEPEINRRIDAGEPIEDILKTTLGISPTMLKEIKGKIFWEISEINHPSIYHRLKEEIQAFEYLSNN